jgi:hypothetical protein
MTGDLTDLARCALPAEGRRRHRAGRRHPGRSSPRPRARSDERFEREFVDFDRRRDARRRRGPAASYLDVCEPATSTSPLRPHAGNPITVKIDPQDGGGTTLTEWTDYIWRPLPAKHGVYTASSSSPRCPSTRNWRRGRRASSTSPAPGASPRSPRTSSTGPTSPSRMAAQGRRRLLQRLQPRRGPRRARLNAARRRDGRPS